MIKIGEYNSLEVSRESKIGFYLKEVGDVSATEILVPTSNIIGTLEVGEEKQFFIYRDSEDRLVATMRSPLATVGEIAYLKVVAKTHIGLFVDIGLQKDVLVPFKEITYPMEVGKSYMFYIYLDKTGRIAATPRIDKRLQYFSPYNVGDVVNATVYDFSENGSALTGVENSYRGLILKSEYFHKLLKGEKVKAKVTKVYEDGTLCLSLRLSSIRDERMSIEDKILEYLKNHDGVMPFCDKSSPDDIRNEFNTSKNYFKNALGGLMKKKLITQDGKCTYLVPSEEETK